MLGLVERELQNSQIDREHPMKLFAFSAALVMTAGLATAQEATGDAEAGGKAFERQCVACHVVKDTAGETLAGRNARTGPNLYGVVGGAIGSVEGFRYGRGLVALNEAGNVWDEASFVGYVQDPTAWLRETTGDSKARSKMAFKVRAEEDAVNLYAYLASLAE